MSMSQGCTSIDTNQCRQLIIEFDRQFAWQLDSVARERYARALVPLLVDVVPESARLIVQNYHLDHRLVAALRDRRHPAHDDTWRQWSLQVIGILRRAGLDWSRDSAVDLEDIAQIACSDLARALPSYRYQSRFISWAYSVVVRSVQRHVRAVQAKRRAAPVTSLDAQATPPADHALPYHEVATNARLLAEQIAAVLGNQQDQRLLPIFRLWAIEERTSAEIGALVGLHESRVRALLKQARAILQNDAAIQQWNTRHEDDARAE